METEILRHLLAVAKKKIQSDLARTCTKLSLATNSVLAADVSAHGWGLTLTIIQPNVSQRGSKMHSISFVADAAACALVLPLSGLMKPAEIEGQEKICEYPAAKSSSRMMLQLHFCGSTSPPQTGTHTLLLLMHHKTNLSSETNLLPMLHLYIYLPNSMPIDLEDLISMVTRVHKFSFWPAGSGSCYYFMDRWTLAQGAEMN